MRAKPSLAVLASGVLATCLLASPGCNSSHTAPREPKAEARASTPGGSTPGAGGSQTSPTMAKAGPGVAADTLGKDPLPPSMPRQWPYPSAGGADVSSETIATDKKVESTPYNRAPSATPPATIIVAAPRPPAAVAAVPATTAALTPTGSPGGTGGEKSGAGRGVEGIRRWP